MMEKSKVLKAGLIVLAVIVLGIFFFKNSVSQADPRIPGGETASEASVVGQCNQAKNDIFRFCMSDDLANAQACNDLKAEYEKCTPDGGGGGQQCREGASCDTILDCGAGAAGCTPHKVGSLGTCYCI